MENTRENYMRMLAEALAARQPMQSDFPMGDVPHNAMSQLVTPEQPYADPYVSTPEWEWSLKGTRPDKGRYRIRATRTW